MAQPWLAACLPTYEAARPASLAIGPDRDARGRGRFQTAHVELTIFEDAPATSSPEVERLPWQRLGTGRYRRPLSVGPAFDWRRSLITDLPAISLPP